MEAGAVPEKAMISHRGEKYEIGRGKRFYGIWAVGAPHETPIDRWPESRDGWEQAWTRFAAIETPGTIGAVSQGRAKAAVDTAGALLAGRRGTALLIGEGLLVLGVVLGLAGLFPDYEGSRSLLAQGDLVVPHLSYVVAWAVSAGVIALGVARPGMALRGALYAALFALGLSAVTLGLFVADLGEVISGGVALGTGLVVSLLGWVACTAGAALAMRAASQSGLARPGRGHAGPLALLVLAGIGTAAAFAPSWDRYTLATTSTGSTQTITAGNAFDNPGLVIAGNVAVMVAVIAVAALAVLWRPARQGALLLAGAIVPLAAQAVSALIQVSEPATAAMFGISSAEASAAGLTISSGVTAIFWVYCVFVIALLISCAWLFTAPGRPAMPAMTGMPAGPWPPIAGGDQAPGTVVDESAAEDADSNGESAAEDADSDGGAEGGEHSAYA
jgi:hypothetical protein